MSIHAAGFSEIYSKHQTAVGRYLVRRGVPQSDIADVCAEVFVVAWSRSDQLPKGSELPWLLAVARNLALAHHRSLTRLATIDVAAAETSPSAADHVISHEAQQMTWRAIQQLSEADRELLMLTAWDGLTTKQAATALSISYSAARVRLHRARRRFDNALKACDTPNVIDLRGSRQEIAK